MERKDPTYRASVDSDGEQIDADTMKDVLNFVDATTTKDRNGRGSTRNEGRVGMEMEAKEVTWWCKW